MAFKIQFKLVIINNVHDCDKLILKSINQLFINEYPTGVIICKNHDSDPWNTQNYMYIIYTVTVHFLHVLVTILIIILKAPWVLQEYFRSFLFITTDLL